MNWVRHGRSTTFETKSSYCRVPWQSLPCYTAVARLGFKRRATAVLKSNLIRSIDRVRHGSTHVWNGPQPFCKHLCQCTLVPVFLGNLAPSWMHYMAEAPAFSLFPSSPVRLLFFHYNYFYWDTQREPLRKERELCHFPVLCMYLWRTINQAQKGKNGYKLWAQWFLGSFEWASISYDRSMVFTANH